MNKETRVMNVNISDNQPENEMIVEGYAIRYSEKTQICEIDGIKYYEVIDSRALDTADLKDVPFKYNHSENIMVMARTRNKTLELRNDSQGLFIRAKLANTSSGRDLYELIKRGDVDKMSFAFTVESDNYDKQTRTRTIKKIKKLYDVAAVDTPAYDTTSIHARSFFELEREKEHVLEKAELRKKLILETYF